MTFVASLAAGTSTAYGASCCGGGFASPSLIVGDDKASLSADLSYSNVATEVSAVGNWEERSSPESLETLRLQGAHIFKDRYQIGASVPVVRRSRASSNSAGFGDVALNFGYETLPDWDYSAWRPRGVSYISVIAPTGRAVQESTETLQLDARGRGFWAVGVGTTLTKTFTRYDFNATAEAHRSFAREVKTSTIEGELRPGYGALASVGLGYNIRDTRLGVSLAFNYEDAIAVDGTITSPGAATQVVTAGLALSQMFGDAWAVSLSYSDQTWFGTPINTSLARTVGFTAQRRFSR
ncbi:hypothetical protein BH10BDE1_BH10BDE1_03010 [soil metagenome]